MLWSRPFLLLPLLFWTTASEYLKYVEEHSCSGDDQKMIESAWKYANKLAHWAYKTSSSANYRSLRKQYLGGTGPGYILVPKVKGRYSTNMMVKVTDLGQIVFTLPVSGILASSVQADDLLSELPATIGSILQRARRRNATPTGPIQDKHTP
jgi:hypothetical protein